MLLILALSGVWQRNLDALRTSAACLPGGQASLLDRLIGKNDPVSPYFRALQARCAGEVALEMAAWGQVLAEEPNRVDLVRTFHPESIELAQTAVNAHADNAPAQFWLGSLLASQEQVPAAIQAYRRGLQARSGDSQAWYELGRLLESQGDIPGAIQAYDRACYRMDPGKNGCPNAGRLYLQSGEYELAASRYRQSTLQLPGWAPAKIGLGQALIELGRLEEARKILQPLAESGEPQALELLARIGP